MKDIKNKLSEDFDPTVKDNEELKEIHEIFHEVKDIHKEKKINTFIIAMCTVLMIIISVMCFYFFFESKNISASNDRLTLLMKHDTIYAIVDKDVKSYFRNIQMVSKIECMPYTKYSKDELEKMAIELTVGEVYYKINHIEILALISAESFGYKRAVSKKGAMGLMQIMPDTKQYMLEEMDEEELDRFDVAQNIRVGIKYYNKCKYRLKNGFGAIKGIGSFPTQEQLLWAYNSGYGNVLRNKWYEYPAEVYYQSKEYVKKWNFYYANYRYGVYDVYYEYPNRRYSYIASVMESNK